MKAWYTLFSHAYNFNQSFVKPFISEQIHVLFVIVTKWPMALTTCPLSEVPSYLNASLTLSNVVSKEYHTERTATIK